MTEGTITTTVYFEDFQSSLDDTLTELQEAYNELTETAREQYGEDDEPAPRDEWPEETRGQAEAYNEAGKAIQKRQHVLESLQPELDPEGVGFELKMLSGSELMDIETELRMEAQKRDTQPQALQAYRQQLVVDQATIRAPDPIPTDDDGSPVPSECPNPLTLELHERAEEVNTAGVGDFRAPGFDDETSGAASGTFEAPRSAVGMSKPSPPTDETPSGRGDSS